MGVTVKTLGIDVGGTNLRLGVFANTVLLEETRFQADFSKICHEDTAHAKENVLQILAQAIQGVLNRHADIQVVGIGFPGFIYPQTQQIAQSPNFPGLEHADLVSPLQKQLGLPVCIVNDANAAAYGEYYLLNKPERLIYMGLGTGIGGGLILANKLMVGQQGAAMEVGHIIVMPDGRLCGCGNRGCVEQYASASGVTLTYAELTNITLTAHEIANLAHADDAHAIAAYQLAGDSLAAMLAHVQKVLDVPDVVIGGGMCAAWDLLQDAFNARLQHDLIPVLRDKINIHLSKAGDIAGMLGASLLARDI